MNFKSEMKRYKSLTPEKRLEEVLSYLKIIKDKNKNLLKTYNILTTNKNVPIELVDNLFKVLLEAMIYQDSLNEKEKKKKMDQKIKKINSSLNTYLEQEKLEREKEARESEELLNLLA